MIITKRALSRRTFLRGTGVAIALPFLDAMVPALSAASDPVMRLGFFYVGNGMQMNYWTPQGPELGAEFPRILRSLEPFRDQLTIVSGLANARAEAPDSGVHTRPCAAWLSGNRPKAAEGGSILAATTIDQIAAQKLGEDTPLRSLELAAEAFSGQSCEGVYSCSYLNTTSWRSPTMPQPMETNPYAVFERLFGAEGNAAARIAQMRMDRSILDAVTGAMQRLNGRLGVADRTTVSEYLDSVREVERQIQQVMARADQMPTETAPVGVPPAYEDHVKLLLDLELLAYRADLTRVTSFQLARELSVRSYPQVGVAEAHHDMSHSGNNVEKIEKAARINAYHVGLFSYFLDKMRKTRDGDGTLLDHSLLLYGAGFGYGNGHAPFDLPVALLGGACGRLKGNRHVIAQKNLPMMNLGLALLDKVGVELPDIGDSTGRLAGL